MMQIINTLRSVIAGLLLSVATAIAPVPKNTPIPSPSVTLPPTVTLTPIPTIAPVQIPQAIQSTNNCSKYDFAKVKNGLLQLGMPAEQVEPYFTLWKSKGCPDPKASSASNQQINLGNIEQKQRETEQKLQATQDCQEKTADYAKCIDDNRKANQEYSDCLDDNNEAADRYADCLRYRTYCVAPFLKHCFKPYEKYCSKPYCP